MKSEGFFPESTVISKPPSFRVARCKSCGLLKTCKSPKMSLSGKGQKKIMLVAETPGKNEDDKNKQFVGVSGKFLEETLASFGINMRRDCWLTNAVICRPPENIKPTNKQIAYCRPNLLKEIREKNPENIILMGMSAVKSLIGEIWKDSVGDVMGRWAGWRIPSQELNAWVCPVWHPAGVMRQERENKGSGQINRKLFTHVLRMAIKQPGRPWAKVPNYKKQIECILSPTKAAKAIIEIMKMGEAVVFDYETDRAKPDPKDSRIVCCSVANSKRVIAFPWHGEAIRAMRKLLSSPIPKWAQNMKFEERWTRKEFGKGVRNWQWDSMLGMHWMDNRRKITGLKFQSFVLLGYGSYNDPIEPFLKSRASNERNRIDDVDINQLLTYCGEDSLLEYKICEIQRKKLS